MTEGPLFTHTGTQTSRGPRPTLPAPEGGCHPPRAWAGGPKRLASALKVMLMFTDSISPRRVTLDGSMMKPAAVAAPRSRVKVAGAPPVLVTRKVRFTVAPTRTEPKSTLNRPAMKRSASASPRRPPAAVLDFGRSSCVAARALASVSADRASSRNAVNCTRCASASTSSSIASRVRAPFNVLALSERPPPVNGAVRRLLKVGSESSRAGSDVALAALTAAPDATSAVASA